MREQGGCVLWAIRGPTSVSLNLAYNILSINLAFPYL